MSDFILNRDQIIYQEMMTHTPLFAHLNPKTIAISCDPQSGLLLEALKHTSIIEAHMIIQNETDKNTDDARVKYCLDQANDWISNVEKNFFDVLIIEKDSPQECFTHYLQALKSDGILIQLSGSPFEVQTIKTTHHALLSVGFRDVLMMSFPQPTYPTGWRSALMAKKNNVFKKVREKDIFNKTFPTHYYNFDVHKAALVVPEFLRDELTI